MNINKQDRLELHCLRNRCCYRYFDAKKNVWKMHLCFIAKELSRWAYMEYQWSMHLRPLNDRLFIPMLAKDTTDDFNNCY